VAERHRKVLWNHGGASDAIARRNFRFVVTLASPASRYFVGILRMLTHVAPFANRVALVYRARGTFPPAVIDGAERYARDNDPAHQRRVDPRDLLRCGRNSWSRSQVRKRAERRLRNPRGRDSQDQGARRMGTAQSDQGGEADG
jgi:hypothetical protein